MQQTGIFPLGCYITVHGPSRARLLMRHGPFLARLVSSNEKACVYTPILRQQLKRFLKIIDLQSLLLDREAFCCYLRRTQIGTRRRKDCSRSDYFSFSSLYSSADATCAAAAAKSPSSWQRCSEHLHWLDVSRPKLLKSTLMFSHLI